MIIIKINKEGCNRVLNGQIGMTFPVDKFTVGVLGPVAHVRDYRFGPTELRAVNYQIWSIGADGYEIVEA